MYQPFCANYEYATELALKESKLLSQVTLIEAVRELPSFLIKPVQRVCRYPLLLKVVSF